MRINQILVILTTVAVTLAQFGILQEKITTPLNEVFHLPEPKQFARVIRSFLHLNSDDLICQAIDRQTFTKIHAYYHLSEYLPDSPDASWPTQIVTAVNIPSKSKVYAALSTGSIVETNYREGSTVGMLVESKGSTVGMLVESNRWELQGSNGSWMAMELIGADDKLVGLSSGRLRVVQFDQKVWRWGDVLVEGAIIKALFSTHLYALARHRLTVIGRGQFLAVDNEQLIDFAVNQGVIYLLTSKTLRKLKADSLQVLSTLSIPQIQHAHKIAVNGSKVLVYYQRHQQSVLQQFRIQGNQLMQIIRYHHLSKVQSISLQGSAAVIGLPSEFALLQLSLQTTSFLAPSDRQLTYGYDTVISIEVISPTLLMLVLPGEVQFVEVLNKLHGIPIFGGALACTSNKKGIIDLQIKYQGFCGVDRLLECDGTVQYSIEVLDNHKQEIVATNELLLLTIISFLTLISACLFLRWQQKIWIRIKEEEAKTKRRQQMTLSQQMITSDMDKMDKTEPDVSI